MVEAMPVKCRKGKPKYRVKTTTKGKKVRLAFCGGTKKRGGTVVEAKVLKRKKRK